MGEKLQLRARDPRLRDDVAEPAPRDARAPGKQTRTGELASFEASLLAALQAESKKEAPTPAAAPLASLAARRARRNASSLAPSTGESAGDWELSPELLSALGLSDLEASPNDAAAASPPRRSARGSSPHIAVPSSIQAKGELSDQLDRNDISATAARGVAAAASPLPHLDAIQRAFGRHDVSHIRAQIGGPAAAASQRLGAQAYATGDRVAFASSPDLHTAAHEAAHVVQQAGGVHLADGLGQRGDVYEQHADAVADAVVAGRSAEGLLDRFTPATSRSASPGPSAPSATASAVQRVAATYLAGKDFRAMTLDAFDLAAQAQVDWATSPQLGADKEPLRNLLRVGRAEDSLLIVACGAYSVDELIKLRIGSGGADSSLLAYSRAVKRSPDTISVEVGAPNAALAIQWGDAIVSLCKVLGPTLARAAIPQNDRYAAVAALATPDVLGDFLAYYTKAKPLLDASDGREIRSFLEFHREKGHLKVGEYQGVFTSEIRNYHRFTGVQLEQAKKNRADAPANKERGWFTRKETAVIMQTAFDHSAAFHRNESLTQALVRTTHVTLLIEGKASLAEFSAELAKFASFSYDGKLHEIMLTGHGGSRSMELAGDRTDAGTKKEDVDVDRSKGGQPPETTAFLNSLAAVLRDDPDARLVLQACLTGSRFIDSPLPEDPKQAIAEIQQAVKRQPNLAFAMRERLRHNQAQVISAKGSYGGAAGMDEGRLGIHSKSDPFLTASPLEYVESGRDPKGVLRATLESWAKNDKKTFDVVQSRIAATKTYRDWRQRLICSAMRIIAKTKSPAVIQSLGEAVAALDQVLSPTSNMVATLEARLPPTFRQSYLEEVFTSLTDTLQWNAPSHRHLPLVISQVWIRHTPARLPLLLQFLDTSTFTTRTIAPFLDLAHLEPHLPSLLPAPTLPKPPRGSFLIALRYGISRGANAPELAKRYLAAVAQGQEKFPEASGASALLDEAFVFDVLATARPAAGPPPPNLTPTGAGQNTHTVVPLTLLGVVHTSDGAAATAFATPPLQEVGQLPQGMPLNIIGVIRADAAAGDDLLAVESTLGAYKTVFLRSRDVRDA